MQTNANEVFRESKDTAMTLSTRISATAATLGVTGALLLSVGPAPATLVEAVSRAARDPRTTVEAADADQVLGCIAAGAAWLVLLWVAGALLLTALGTVPGAVGRAATAAAHLVVPGALRRLAAASLGLGLVAGVGAAAVGTPASAAPAPPPAVTLNLDWPAGGQENPTPVADRPVRPDSRTGDQHADSAVRDAAVQHPDSAARAPHAPIRPPGTPAHGADIQRRGAQPPHAGRHVTVRPGDSLWAIAARDLGPGASGAEVATAWPRWWAANRPVVGADPDVIHPGQRLSAPGPDDVTGRTP